jgi:subtilisin family serine protease
MATPGVLCTSGGSQQTVVRSTQSVASATPIARASFRSANGLPHYSPNVLEVAYANGGVKVLRVDAVHAGTKIAELQVQRGVKSVSHAALRYVQSTTAALVNDPYYLGFLPANTPPFYESASMPGQWDMHVICAANAWGYANSNSTGRTIAAAAGGSSAAPIAIVDTGADLTHPDLKNRVTYAESVLNGVVTPGLAAMHDNDGHGTNVAGIAAASGNNGFGFTGVAYKAPLMIFKVFPDPPAGGCPSGSTDPQCTALGSDVGLAITDAVNHGAKVISLSLGDQSPDTAEESAVANAIAHGVVVVAASGNESSIRLDYPARDPGVIAVGASGLDDSNPASVVETIASYSNYDSTNPNTWGIVAPGGTAGSSSDADDLHWIVGLYTSTAADGSSPNSCSIDRAGALNDCREAFAGTSQATPHVAGAAALLLGSGASANQIKTLLCGSATPIPGGRSGCGRLNVYRAMALLLGDPSP